MKHARILAAAVLAAVLLPWPADAQGTVEDDRRDDNLETTQATTR